MHVMPAGVHHRHGLSGAVGGRYRAGIRQTCGFLNWERVHVGAQHDSRTIAVPQYTNYSGFSDSPHYVITCSTETIRSDTRCPGLLHR